MVEGVTDARQIPGFTEDQTWALMQVVKQAVREANEHDERVRRLERCIYGNGEEGLEKCVGKLCHDVATLVWWYRLLVGAVVGSWLTLLVGLLSP